MRGLICAKLCVITSVKPRKEGFGLTNNVCICRLAVVGLFAIGWLAHGTCDRNHWVAPPGAALKHASGSSSSFSSSMFLGYPLLLGVPSATTCSTILTLGVQPRGSILGGPPRRLRGFSITYVSGPCIRFLPMWLVDVAMPHLLLTALLSTQIIISSLLTWFRWCALLFCKESSLHYHSRPCGGHCPQFVITGRGLDFSGALFVWAQLVIVPLHVHALACWCGCRVQTFRHVSPVVAPMG